uniref:Uncharacterized protein n=1 Tax=Avena sativa TaxID=4498 RepID=A0ACD5V3Q6_AVESA
MGNLRAGGIVSLPIIDLRRGHDECRRAVLDAGKEMGFFQVVNHGVAEQAMRDVGALCHEFFALPEADKAAFYSEDNDKTNRYFSGSTYETVVGHKYWIDCLRLGCTIPVGSSTRDWPDKPNNFRQVVEKFAVQTRSMGMELLRLLAEGMGLRTDYFDGDLGGTDVILGINHYPACPDPTTMIGLPPHCDRNLLTLLIPNKVPGLQLLHNGEWVHVEPLPNAFVVHTGLAFEVVTNGMLKSREHRVVTNTTLARIAVGMFITPTKECLITPAEEFLIGDENPPRYRAVAYREFVRIHGTAATSVRTTNLRTH